MMKFHCLATEFLRSVYLIYLNQYLPAIQTLRRPKNNLNCPPFFFSQLQSKFVACVLRENLSNRSSRVQIPRDICTRLGCYLYSTRCSWIIRTLTTQLTIIGQGWAKYRDLSVASRSIICRGRLRQFLLLS